MGGGKKEKASTSSGGLGRALVRNHNEMLRQSKEKGVALRKQQRRGAAAPLESVTEVTDLEAVIEQAEENGRVYSIANPTPALRHDLNRISDSNGEALTEEDRKKEEALHASSLRVPRRPPWSANMPVEELNANERESFLAWRRNLARLEENEKLVLTPFEKNLDIWRQLWRVLERSDLLVMVVDARDPLFYRCPDLEAYAQEIDEHKRTLLLVNKADLLPISIRMKWAKYFQQQRVLFAFWSAKIASSTFESRKMNNTWKEQIHSEESFPVDMDTKIYNGDELLARLQAEAEAIVYRRESNKKILKVDDLVSRKGKEFKQVVVGFVGYPNVGKSSTINALVGKKRTGVTSTPGKTKHFQTLIISDKLILCDCPGLVFPSFSSSRYEMIASGVLPIDRMTEHREAVQVVANRVPRDILERIYNITLPKPKPYEPQSRPPLASELLRSFCSSRGYVGSSGLPDETRAARQILKDYLDGKIPHFEMPPGMLAEENELADGLPYSDYCESDSFASSDEEQGAAADPIDGDVSLKPDMDLLLNDLELFDVTSGDSKTKADVKKSSTSHKHHKKPQKKKDRSWRVGNDGGDGMPVVRVFQKPAINFASMKSSA